MTAASSVIYSEQVSQVKSFKKINKSVRFVCNIEITYYLVHNLYFQISTQVQDICEAYSNAGMKPYFHKLSLHAPTLHWMAMSALGRARTVV